MSVFLEFLITIVIALLASLLAGSVAARAEAHRRRSDDTNRIAHFSERWFGCAFAMLVLAYVLIFSYLSVVRHLAFKTGDIVIDASWDLGQYDQLIWNSLHGRLLENTFVPDAPIFLGKTFTPILLALVPLYAVWSDPIVLLVLQSFALGIGAFPIYWLARERLGHLLAFAMGLAYLLSPALASINLTEFHEIALATPVLAYATFFLLRRHYPGLIVTLLVALLIKEECALIAAAFGVFIFLFQKNRRLGLALVLAGAIWAMLLLQAIIPSFRADPSGAFYYFGSGVVAGGGGRYGYLGHSLPEIVATLLTRPDVVWTHVVIPAKIEYVLQLLVPLALLPLLGAEVLLLALPTLGYSLLSEFEPQYSIHFFYSAALLPFFFFAAILGAERLLGWMEHSRRAVAPHAAIGALLIVSGVSSYRFQSVAPSGLYYQADRYVVTPHAILGETLMRAIPDAGAVATQHDLLGHLSQRRQVYEISEVYNYRRVDYLVADTASSWYAPHRLIWEGYLATGYFEVLSREDGYLIARRKSPAANLNIHFGPAMTLLGCIVPGTDTWRGGTTLRPIVEWRADESMTERYVLEVQVTDARGHVWATDEREPQAGNAPTNRWQAGQTIGDQYELALPPTMPTGDYEITLGVRNSDGAYLSARDANGRDAGQVVTLATVRIEKNKASFTASQLQIEQPLQVDFGEIRLLGFVPPRKTIMPGELLQTGLYWRARGKPQGDYTIVVQLRDSSGRMAFEQRSRPAGDTFPTTQWDVGEVLLDWHDFNLPEDLAPGVYDIFVALDDSATGTRMGQTRLTAITVEMPAR